MAVKIVIRATLKGNDVGAIRKIHDEVTSATRHMAQEAGDISHHVYLNPRNPRDFLGVDRLTAFRPEQCDGVSDMQLRTRGCIDGGDIH